MKKILAGAPLLRLLFPFIAGIGIAYEVELKIPFVISLMLIALMVGGILFRNKFRKRSFNPRGTDGIMIMIAFFICGSVLAACHLKDSENSLVKAQKVDGLIVAVLSEPVVRENSIRMEVRISSFELNKKWFAADERMIVYLKRSTSSAAVRYGYRLLIHARPYEVEPPKNPGEFNYKEWLSRKNIYSTVYIDDGAWATLDRGNGNWFVSLAFRLRNYCLEEFKAYGLTGNEYGVASALLVGASDQLDPGLIRSYSASGVLHVLSVSGMHVALIYVILLKLLAPIERRRGKLFSICIQLVFLWFYATLTGLCPSVLRSVTMLSLVILGKVIGRNSSIVNSLAASALILLLFDPMLLFDTGFQLSYLAVGGIVLVQPMFSSVWEPDFFLWRHLWTMFTVTITAQLFTFPLALYYFKQFPTYFLPANLILIPLSTLILYLGILFLVCSPVKFIAKPLAVLFIFCLSVLNSGVEFTEHMPEAVIRTSAWNLTELFLLFAVIILFLRFLVKREGVQFNSFLGAVALLLFLIFLIDPILEKKSEMCFFADRKGAALGVVYNEKGLLFSDSSILNKAGDIDFHIFPWFENRGIYATPILPLDTSDAERDLSELLTVEGKRILFLGSSLMDTIALEDVDLVYVGKKGAKKIYSINGKPGKLIIVGGADLYEQQCDRLMQFCSSHGFAFHDLKKGGAVQMDL